MDKKCIEKLTFESKSKALGAANAIKFQRGTKLKPYKCTTCQHWHLTSIYKT